MSKTLKVKSMYLSTTEIMNTVAKLGTEISKYYKPMIKENEKAFPLMVVPILKGAFLFAADLVKTMTIPVRMEFIEVTSYKGELEAQAEPYIDPGQLFTSIQMKHVLVVDTITDRGSTLRATIGYLKRFLPASIKTCVLIDRSWGNAPVDFCGVEERDVFEFLVGYGLDYKENCRHLSSIWTIEEK